MSCVMCTVNTSSAQSYDEKLAAVYPTTGVAAEHYEYGALSTYSMDKPEILIGAPS